jgi:hypothetical protein
MHDTLLVLPDDEIENFVVPERRFPPWPLPGTIARDPTYPDQVWVANEQAWVLHRLVSVSDEHF